MLCWHIIIFYELISVSECCHVTTPSLWFQRYRLSRGSQSDKSLKHKHTHTHTHICILRRLTQRAEQLWGWFLQLITV